ncbi:Xaa-Pro aminopeptidase [Mesorhizobium sp. LHD-90]|uniref:Xaa-Pro aminopeptidase n=1 Tax=Mesorhizobium sp. LHD-90 TaxID=3071414 RepID=UPI0027DF254E|nr:Xaa-Pro aminopeptidase [Mesorhizobium sp. LHD-90]MDQ6436252.1 Xaa-Pro aminopeptidase [Mesorhizobium sp. LHD-90]
MTVVLRTVDIPDFGLPVERPAIPAATYEARCATALQRAEADWLVVYADREHAANIAFLTGFEPRFEEALLLLGSGDRRIVVTGNENLGYTPIAGLPGIVTMLAQSLSLMAQDRSEKPDLVAVLREAGLAAGDSVGLVGWKYLESEEWVSERPTFFVPAFVVDAIGKIVTPAALTDATRVLMHPTDGLRAVVDVDQIAEAEWAAARAAMAVWRIVSGFRLGDNELVAASRMGYAGEPMSCHPMFATNDTSGPVIGLRSPTARIPKRGDGVTAAVGYWGGLTARAGLIAEHEDGFLELAKAYFRGLIAWYETAGIGIEGGAIHDAVISTLARGKLRPALNPGHLVGLDEWMHSPIRPGSTDRIVSGMPFQVDIIPVPMPDGWALNCEDPVTFADQGLRTTIAQRHPALARRFEARRRFVAEQIGIAVKDDMLLLSAIPLCLAPFWLASGKLLGRD